MDRFAVIKGDRREGDTQEMPASALAVARLQREVARLTIVVYAIVVVSVALCLLSGVILLTAGGSIKSTDFARAMADHSATAHPSAITARELKDAIDRHNAQPHPSTLKAIDDKTRDALLLKGTR